MSDATPGRAQRALSSRDVALAVARDVFGTAQRSAQAAFDYRVRKAGLGPRDRAFAAELAYGAIKMRRALDWYLRPYVGKRGQPLPAAIAEALRIGAYQVHFMGGVEGRAAVFETVGAALRVGHRGTAGLVNAILRRMIADGAPPPERADFASDAEYLGTRYSVPDWIAAQFQERFGARTEAVLAGIDSAPQTAVRVNELRATLDGVRDALAERGVAVAPSPFVRDVLVVESGAGAALGDDAEGRWALQSEASGIAVDVLDPQPGERVVDICSGRGNKAVQIASRMRGEGTLQCVELEPARVAVLERRLAEAGASAAVVCGDATLLAQDATADAALIDAPCSGLGVLGRHPEARWRKRPDDAERLSAVQAALLRAGALTVRDGGRIVYSVCTTDRRECEDVVDAFLAQEPAFSRAAPPERYAAFATAAGDIVVPPGIDGRDGFYVALLRRSA
jgi:16S rRNA (cytosine967-C5)-methyltransferase